MDDARIPTPCVGMCSTTYGDMVCRGCRRFSHEIVDWNAYGATEKRAVWARLDALKEQVVLGRLDIVDPLLLEEKLDEHRIPWRAEQPDAVRAYELLRRGARFMRRYGVYGLRPLPRWHDLTPSELLDVIDRDLLALAHAHYERYVVPTLERFG